MVRGRDITGRARGKRRMLIRMLSPRLMTRFRVLAFRSLTFFFSPLFFFYRGPLPLPLPFPPGRGFPCQTAPFGHSGSSLVARVFILFRTRRMCIIF